MSRAIDQNYAVAIRALSRLIDTMPRAEALALLERITEILDEAHENIAPQKKKRITNAQNPEAEEEPPSEPAKARSTGVPRVEQRAERSKKNEADKKDTKLIPGFNFD